ncbi:MAG: single-stranded DNA-binding protein [Firmicutes bacterium]|nr:single-stranded DNA-binding protein [Bacillota bacterium]
MENVSQPSKSGEIATLTNNNRVMLHGVVVGEPIYSHAVFGEGHYELGLSVNRLSSIQDVLPITVPEKFIKDRTVIAGKTLTVKGQFRSYNKLVDGKSKLMLTIFVREVDEDFIPDNPNIIELCGYVCKAPIYRTTPFNREIADVLVAVNRTFGKSDYIPSIAWGRNARLADELSVGEKVFLNGRIQSREYQKRFDNGQVETRVAYEVSVGKISKEQIESQFVENDTAFTFDNEEMMESLGIN